MTGSATAESSYRVTSAEVQSIFPAPAGVTDLSMFIRPANVLVNTHLVDQELSDSLLKEIELWLAAHFAAVRYKQLAEQSIKDARDVYQGKTDMGLKATLYGQQAMLLDSTGILASLGEPAGRSAGIDVLGHDDDL